MRIDGQGGVELLNRQNMQNPVKTVKTPVEKQEREPAVDMENAQVREKLDKVVELINQALKVTNNHLEFRLHEASGRYQVKVVDSDTNEVIREIPPERMLDFSARVQKMLDDAMGILFDEKI